MQGNTQDPYLNGLKMLYIKQGKIYRKAERERMINMLKW